MAFINGTSGDDTLSSTNDNDTLTGGSGADTFVFSQNSGHDIIAGFDPNEDFIDLSSTNLTAQDMIASLTEIMGNTTLKISENDTITLQGVSLSNFDEGSLYFSPRLDRTEPSLGETLSFDGSFYSPHIAVLESGRYVVAWRESGNAVSQLFEADGSVAADKIMHSDFGITNAEVNVAALKGGGYVVSWNTRGSSSTYHEIYDTDNNRTIQKFIPGSINSHDIIALDDGGYVVIEGIASPTAYRYSDSGQLLEGDIQVSSKLGGSMNSMAGTQLKSGKVVVVWDKFDGGGSNRDDIGLAIFDNEMKVILSETLVNDNTDDTQWLVDVAPLSNGGFVATWSSWYGGTQTSISYKVYDDAGKAITEEQVIDTDFLEPDRVQVTGLKNGGFTLVWTTKDRKVYSQEFDEGGIPVASALRIDSPDTTDVNDIVYPAIARLDDDEILTAWGHADNSPVIQKITISEDRSTSLVSDNVKGTQQADYIVGMSGNDTLLGQDNADTLIGGLGHDALIGGASNDYLSGGNGLDYLVGGIGNDTQSGGASADILIGNDGNDFLSGNSGNDRLFAGANDTGNDIIEGNSGSDVLGGGKGNDIIVGGDRGKGIIATVAAGNDTLFGGDGNDLLVGGSFDSALNKPISTSGGENLIWAGTGDDTVYGDSGNDLIGGGDGNDFVDADDGNDVLYGGKGSGDNHDDLNAGSGHDRVFASLGNDKVDGGSGSDTLFGGAGDDTVGGGDDNDLIWGGTGNDILKGGKGDDTFAFIAGFGTDTITDFGSGTDGTDTLDLSEIEGLTLADLLATATFSNSGTTLDLGEQGTIILTGIDAVELQAFADAGQILVA